APSGRLRRFNAGAALSAQQIERRLTPGGGLVTCQRTNRIEHGDLQFRERQRRLAARLQLLSDGARQRGVGVPQADHRLLYVVARGGVVEAPRDLRIRQCWGFGLVHYRSSSSSSSSCACSWIFSPVSWWKRRWSASHSTACSAVSNSSVNSSHAPVVQVKENGSPPNRA